MTAPLIRLGASPALLALASLVLAPTAVAGSVKKVSFDENAVDATCSFVTTSPLRNEYAGKGVKFRGPTNKGGGAALKDCGNFGVAPNSGDNFLAFNGNTAYANDGVPIGPETLVFKDGVTMVKILVNKANVNDFGESATFTLLGKKDGETVQTDTVTTSTTDWQTLSVEANKGFTKVVLRADDPDDTWLADDLRFDPK